MADKYMKIKDSNSGNEHVKQQLERDPYNYELYLTLFNQAHEEKNLTSIREILSFMKQKLALSTDLWRRWIRDESTINAEPHSVERLKLILELYDQALEEYLDVDLYLEYINFIEKIDNSLLMEAFDITDELTDWIDDWKTIQWDRAVVATEYNYSYSHKIWNKSFQRKQALAENNSDPELKNLLIQELHTLLLERLAVPHQQLEETFTLYSMYVTKYMEGSYEQIMVQVNLVKENTHKRSIMRENHERKIASLMPAQTASAESYNFWLNYLKAVASENNTGPDSTLNNPLEIATLSERMIVYHFNNPKAWSYYLNLMTKAGAPNERLESIAYRASRNCPWSGEILGLRMLITANHDEFFENTLNSKVLNHSPSEMTLFLLTKINIERNLFIEGKVMEQTLRENCTKCVSTLLRVFPRSPDYEFRVHKYFAFIEASLFNNEENAIQVWEKSPKFYKKSTYFWLAFSQFSKTYLSIDRTREVFMSAISNILKAVKSSDNLAEEQLYLGSEDILSAFLSTEYEIGNIGGILNAVSEIELFKNKLANHLYHLSQKGQDYSSSYKNTDMTGTIPGGQEASKNTKNKRQREDFKAPDDSQLSAPSKKAKSDDMTITIENSINKELLEKYTVAVSPLAHYVKNSQLEKHFSKCGPIRKCEIVNGFASTGSHYPIKIGHISFQSAEGVLNALFQNSSANVELGEPKSLFKVKVELISTVQSYKKAKVSMSTLVVKHVPGDVSEKVLKASLSELTDFCEWSYFSGKDQSSAYLTLLSKLDRESTLKKLKDFEINELKLQLTVEKFDRTLPEHKEHFKYSQDRAVYVSNINYKTTIETITTFFEEYLGTDFFIVDCMTDKNGGFLGQALVYFSSKNTADLALELHDFEIDSRKLCIKPATALETFKLPYSEMNATTEVSKGDINEKPKNSTTEKNKLLSTVRITGFSQNTSTSLLKDISSQIVKVDRIHKNKAGNKIFIDIYNYEDANSLVNKLNGMFIDNSKIRASHVIDPSTQPRNTDGISFAVNQNNRPENIRNRIGGNTGHAPKQRMNILPRNLSLKNKMLPPKDSSNESSAHADSPTTMKVDYSEKSYAETGNFTTKSNDDFRNLFLKK